MTLAPTAVGRLLGAQVADADLLARFAADRDEAAFAELARRHGRMVLAAARRAVPDRHLADDVAQAAFLVLAQKAGRLARPDRLAGWLFGVTRRLARRAADRHLRDARRTRPLADRPAPPDPAPGWADLLRVLDEELDRLPEDERGVLVLCYLEGLTQDEAARACGWSVRTLRRRLAAGRDRLRDRLGRRGVELGTALTALAVGSVGAANGLPPLTPAPGGRAAVLARGALRPAGRVVAGWAAGVTAVALAVGLSAGRGSDPPAPAPGAPAAAEPALPDGAVARLGSAALRHPAALSQLRFTADGAQLFSYGHGKVRRWDAKTGAALRHATRDVATTHASTFLAPDPTKLIALHTDDAPDRIGYSVREYDLTTGAHAERFALPARVGSNPLEFRVGRHALSPDGTLFLEGYLDEAYLWDVAAGRVRHHLKLPTPAPDPAFGPGADGPYAVGAAVCEFTPDGKHLLTAGADRWAVRLWDVATGKAARVLTRDDRPRGGVGGLAASADGRWVVAAGNAHGLGAGTELAVWDLTRPAPPRVLVLADGSGGETLAFGPGDVLYAVSRLPVRGATPVVSKWDVAAGRLLARWEGPHRGDYGSWAAAVSPGGGVLAVGTHSGVIRLYDTRTGAEVVRPPALTTWAIGVTFDPAGAEVRAVGADGSGAAWDATTGTPRSRRDAPAALPPAGEYASVLPSPDGRWLLAVARKPAGSSPPWVAELRDAATGARKHTWGVEGQVTELVPVPGGRYVAGLVETRGGFQLRVWDAATGEVRPGAYPVLLRGRHQWAVFPDGKTFAAVDAVAAEGYDLATARRRFLWPLADHGVLGRPLPDESQRYGLVQAVAASPDGKTLAVAVGGEWYLDAALRPHNLVLVEADTGRVIRRARTPETAPGWLAFSPDGKRIVGPVCVWDTDTLREVRRFPAEPRVSAAGFSPDGRRVATGHLNGTVTVWRLGPE
jgi:RNA polymerase sigma factor (sigma-70 family)